MVLSFHLLVEGVLLSVHAQVLDDGAEDAGDDPHEPKRVACILLPLAVVALLSWSCHLRCCLCAGYYVLSTFLRLASLGECRVGVRVLG